MQNITEPATLVTDYLLAVFTAVLAWKLRAGGLAQRWWAAGLAASSVAGVAGGTVHGFVRVMPPAVTGGLWLLTLEMLVLAGFAVTMATILSGLPSPSSSAVRRAAAAAACLTFAAWAMLIPLRPVFAMAIAASGTSLGVLALVEGRRWLVSRLAASAWLLAGVVLSVAAAVVQQAGWAPHPHFNHNDLFHVIQAGAVWLLYQGARRLPVVF